MRIVVILCLLLAGCQQVDCAHLKVEVGCLFHRVAVEMDIKNK